MWTRRKDARSELVNTVEGGAKMQAAMMKGSIPMEMKNQYIRKKTDYNSAEVFCGVGVVS